MNTDLVPHSVAGDVMPPGSTARVVGLPHVLRGERLDREVPAGLTVAEALALAIERPGAPLVVELDGEAVRAADRDRVRVPAGATVTFRAVPGKGDTLKSVLGIGVALAALFVSGGAAAPFLGPLGAFFAAGTVGASLLAGGVAVAGAVAFNALAPESDVAAIGAARRPGALL